jgi:hypothetical protein
MEENLSVHNDDDGCEQGRNSRKTRFLLGGSIVHGFTDDFEDCWKTPRHDGRSSRRKVNSRKPLMQQQRLKNQRRRDIAENAQDFWKSPW